MKLIFRPNRFRASKSSWLLLLALAVASRGGAESPYQQIIVERNVFALKDPPPPPSTVPEAPPPAKIQLVGIANVLGVRKAVLKPLPAPGAPAKPGLPGQPAVAPGSEPPIVLMEGQALDGIEVIAIDEVLGTVKVNNSGQMLTLNFTENGLKAPSGAAAPVAALPGGGPGVSSAFPAGPRPGTVMPGFPGSVNGSPGAGGIPNPAATGAVASQSGMPERPVRAMSAEELAVLYEANRERNRTLTEAGVLPPTPQHPLFSRPDGRATPAPPGFGQQVPSFPGR